MHQLAVSSLKAHSLPERTGENKHVEGWNRMAQMGEKGDERGEDKGTEAGGRGKEEGEEEEEPFLEEDMGEEKRRGWSCVLAGWCKA